MRNVMIPPSEMYSSTCRFGRYGIRQPSTLFCLGSLGHVGKAIYVPWVGIIEKTVSKTLQTLILPGLVSQRELLRGLLELAGIN